MPGDEVEVVTDEGLQLKLTNLDRVLYPCGTTKAQVIQYYADMAPAIIGQLADRPVTLRRFPDGTGRPGFWQKHCPEYRPDWLEVIGVTGKTGRRVDYCRIDGLTSLVWAANQGTIEFHTTLHRAQSPTRPDWMVLDLDPGEGRGILDCAELALELRARLGDAALGSLVKTTGSKGMHVHVPLGRALTYEESAAVARKIAGSMEKEHPESVVSRMRRSLRAGRIFIDWSQNNASKTNVAAYSLRAGAEPRVATPLRWDEVKLAVDERDARLLEFTPAEAVKRLDEVGDLMEAALSGHGRERSMAGSS